MNLPRNDGLGPPNGGRKTRFPSRRQVLAATGLAAAGGGLASACAWWRRHERGWRSDVFIGGAPSYDSDLAEVIAAGLNELGISRTQMRGKRVVLKPNLVETALGHQHINTDPAVVQAAAEAFLRLDAASVVVAEGQGHRRDSHLVLEESGVGTVLQAGKLSFVDLNTDDPVPAPNRGKWTTLPELYLPRTILEADWVVSLPKLKTHHWAGVTCSMKNLFGVMPGIVYGWPKNVLHYHGIAESILDINVTVRASLAIVDGVIGMEGDGPIMGTPKRVGCLIMGRNLPSVDATATRVMGLDPAAVRYLAEASGRLGPIVEGNIAQRGERISRFASKFSLLDVPHLRGLAS